MEILCIIRKIAEEDATEFLFIGYSCSQSELLPYKYFYQINVI